MYAAQDVNLARRSRKSKGKDRIQETEDRSLESVQRLPDKYPIRHDDCRTYRMSNDEVEESAFSAFICGY